MSQDCVVRIAKLESSDHQQSGRAMESAFTDLCSTADGEDAYSETFDDSSLVIVDECDDSDSGSEVNISVSSPSPQDTKEKVHERNIFEIAANQLPSSVGDSSSRNKKHGTDASNKNQPFVKLKRLAPAEVKKWTASKSKVRDEAHKHKSRYVVCSFQLHIVADLPSGISAFS